MANEKESKTPKGLGTCTICGKPLFRVYEDNVGSTCKAHEGKLRQTATESSVVPEGFLRMSHVCRKAVEQGITIAAVVNAAGGDACTKPLLNDIFRVVYVGRGKFMDPRVLTEGFAMLKKLSKEPETLETKIAAQLKQAVKK